MILYEDNHLLVVEKEPNVPVQADESKDRDLLTIWKEDIKQRYNKPGNVYLGLVHRLDRPVGGAIVFAKTSKGASRLSDTLRKREMERTYVAVVRGVPKERHATLTNYLWKDRKKNIVHVVDRKKKEAKKAILTYDVLATDNELSLVRVRLETGRSHQIRVQLAAIGCPLYGDQKYGQSVNRPGEQLALWSHELTFPHPTKKEEMTFTSFPPNEYPWSKWEHLLKEEGRLR